MYYDRVKNIQRNFTPIRSLAGRFDPFEENSNRQIFFINKILDSSNDLRDSLDNLSFQDRDEKLAVDDTVMERPHSTIRPNLLMTPTSIEKRPALLLPKKSALEALYDARPIIPNSSNHAVLKLSNLPWETTIADVDTLFSPLQVCWFV